MQRSDVHLIHKIFSILFCPFSIWLILAHTDSESLVMGWFMLSVSTLYCLLSFWPSLRQFQVFPQRARKTPVDKTPVLEDTNTKTILGLVGSAALVIGVFAPILNIPIVGSINSFGNGKGDGVILLVLALLSVLLVLNKRFRMLWLTGGTSLGIVISFVVGFQLRLAEVKGDMDTDLAGNPFRGFADLAVASFQLQWGLAVLAIGSILIMSSAGIKAR